MIQVLTDLLEKHAGSLIALCALGLTVYQASIARRHNRLSVRPHLARFTYRDITPGRGVLAVRLLNKGIGPAFIKSFQILLDGVPITDPDEALSTVLAGRKYNLHVTTLGDDYAMSAGEEKDLLILVLPLKGGETLEQVEEQIDRFDLVVKYNSAYKELGTLDTRIDRQSANKALKPTQQRRAA